MTLAKFPVILQSVSTMLDRPCSPGKSIGSSSGSGLDSSDDRLCPFLLDFGSTLYRWRVKVWLQSANSTVTCGSDWSFLATMVTSPAASLWTTQGSPIWIDGSTPYAVHSFSCRRFTFYLSVKTPLHNLSQYRRYVFLRGQYRVPRSDIAQAVAYIFASPQQDQKLLGTTCCFAFFRLSFTQYLTFLILPPAASSSPLHELGAYRLFIDGAPITAGPGRGDGATADPQGCQVFDAVNVTSWLLPSNQAHVFALQGYRAPGSAAVGQPGIHLVLKTWFSDGSTDSWATNSGDWLAFNATDYFNPYSSTASAYQQPREYMDARRNPLGWRTASFVPSASWLPAKAQLPFNPAPRPKTTLPLTIEWVSPPVLRRLSPGRWFFDFQTELMAGLALTVVNVGCASCCCQLVPLSFSCLTIIPTSIFP